MSRTILVLPENLAELRPAARIEHLFRAVWVASKPQVAAWLALCEIASGNAPRQKQRFNRWINRVASDALHYLCDNEALRTGYLEAGVVGAFLTDGPTIDSRRPPADNELPPLAEAMGLRWEQHPGVRTTKHYWAEADAEQVATLEDPEDESLRARHKKRSERATGALTLTSAFLTQVQEALATHPSAQGGALGRWRRFALPLLFDTPQVAARFERHGEPVGVVVNAVPRWNGPDAIVAYVQRFLGQATERSLRLQHWLPQS